MKSKYTKKQRVLAILGIILLVGLYLAALIASFFNSPTAQGFLCSALFCTFFIPIVIYLLQFFAKKNSSSPDDDDKSFPIKGVFGPLFFRFSSITSSSISI